MNITCAISPSQLEKLYKHVSINMQEAKAKNKTFDPNVYMDDLFNKIKSKSGVDTAVKFLQPVPLMIFKAYTTIPNYVDDVVMDVDPVLRLNRLFTDEGTGLRNVLNAFAPEESQSVLKEAMFKTELASVYIPYTRIEQIEPYRFQPINIFSGTLQQFESIDKQQLDKNLIQNTSEERALFYKVFSKLTGEETSTVGDDLVYQNEKVRLKPVKLTDVSQDDLDGVTKRFLVRANSIIKQGSAKERVVKPNDIILTVLADESGNPLRFDSDGNISDEGRIVYQMMRNVVKEGNKFKPVNLYGYETFQDAVSKIADDLGVSKEAAEKIFQQQLKALYTLRNNILDGKVNRLTIAGFSAGIERQFTQKSLSIGNLKDFNLTDAIQTITMAKEKGSFQATIMLQNENFKINRPYLDKATAEKIAEVLTNDKLSYGEKKMYVNQFLTDTTNSQSVRHRFLFLDTNQKIQVTYFDKTYEEDNFRKSSNLDLSDSASKEKIVSALTEASSINSGMKFPVATIYSEGLLDSNSFVDYNLDTGKFEKSDISYTEYLGSLNGGRIDLSSANAEEVFNQYINFAIPSQVLTQLNKAEENKSSDIRKRKDAIAELVSTSDKPITVEITKVRSGEFEGTKYTHAFFNSPIDGSEVKIRVKKNKVSEGDIATLFVENKTTADMYIPNILTAVVNNKPIGTVEETDFNNDEKDRTELYKQLYKNRQKKSIDEQIDNATTKQNTKDPNKGGLASRFGFDRSGKLPADPGTKEQNKKAMEWWAQSDLNKYLDLETGVNIVNSDAFGRFISYGSVLGGKYGKLTVTDKGTAVDLYHEAWHGFTQLFLTPKDRKRLYQEVKRSLKGTKELSYFEIEEYLAEEFRKYAKNPKARKNTPARNSIFRRILNFLKKLFGVGYTTNALEIKKVQEMFEALYYNKGLNKYNPAIDNVQFDLLERNIGITLPGTDQQVLSRQESLLISNSMDSIISDIVDEVTEDIRTSGSQNSKGVALSMVLNPNKKAILYDVVKERLQNKRDSFQTEKENTVEDDQFKIEQLDEKLRVLDGALEGYETNDGGTVAFHMENSSYKILTDSYIEDELIADENKTIEDSVDEKIGDKKIGDTSLLDFAGKETLYMLKSLHEVNNGKVTKNQLGFKKLADFRLTWNNVVRTIAGQSDPQVMYDKLVEVSDQYEPFKQLTESKLPNPKSPASVFDFKATTSFWQDFNKSRVPYIQHTMFNDGTSKVLNASLDTKRIVRNFNNKYKTDQDNPYLILDSSTGNTQLNLEKVVTDFGKNGSLDKAKSLDFARSIGIYLDDIQTIREELQENSAKYGLSFIYTSLNDVYESTFGKNISNKVRVELQDFLQDPVSGLYKGISKELTGTKASKQYTQINRLAELQGRFGEAANIFGVLNAAGDLVFEYIENNTVATKSRFINSADNFTDLINSSSNPMSYLDPSKNTFTEKSVLLRSLFNLNSLATSGNKIQNTQLELFISSGTNSENGDGFNTSDLDANSKFLQDFHTMLIDGTQEFIRAASKKSAFGLRFRGSVRNKLGQAINSKGSNLYIETSKFVDDYAQTVDMINTQFMMGYLASEGNRIHKFTSNETLFDTYAGFNRVLPDGKKAGASFTIFDDVLTPETKAELYDLIESKKNETFDLEDYLVNTTLGIKVKSELNDYFTNRISEVYQKISQPNVKLSKTLLGQVKDASIDDITRMKYLSAAYYYNAWIHNFETANLIEGDLSQYKHSSEELSKRSPGTKSGGKTFRVDKAAKDFINSKSFQSGSYAVLANKNNKFSYNGTITTAIMQDIKRDSVYISEIKKALEKYYNNGILSKAEIKKLVDNDISKYEGMEEADGQGYITFDTYRALKYLENDWSYQQEALFKKIAKGEKVDAKTVTELMPPYKLFYSGNIKEAQLPMNSMHKFALMPLIPSIIKGGDLESLHNQMIEKGIGYSLFSTGSKTSHIAANGSADVIYDEGVNEKQLKSNIEFTPNTIYVDYLKNVTAVPKKFKSKTIFSTQFRKLILKDLYNRGIVTDPKAKSSAEKYDKLINDYMIILEEQLLNEIGYKKEGGKYIGNIENFLDLVQRELGRRNLPEHQINFVGENINKTLKTDLSFHFKAGDIEKMIVGVIEKRLIKQRVNGEALVAVSSAMTNGMWGTSTKFANATSEQQKLYSQGTNNLPFYTKNADGSTAAMKVAIAIQGDFMSLYNVKDKDGQSIKVYDVTNSLDDAGNPIETRTFNESATLANLNELIKDEEWLNADEGRNRKLITMTAVRIPVQGLNSMEFMEVFEFLPAEAGNILIPPTEIVAKSGSDFDIDKLNVFMPNIKDGELVKYDASVKKVKSILDISTDKTKELVLESKKKSLENDVIETMTDILKLESNYANLVRPNSTYLVKEEISDKIADKVAEYDRYKNVSQPVKVDKDGKKYTSPTRSIEPLYNVEKFAENMTGKKVLGIVAIENALSVLFNASKNGKMPKTYKQDGQYNEITKKYIPTDKNLDMRLFLPHNKFSDGSISISDVYSQDGNSIGELYSQILNGFVDIEKDPWVFNIGGSREIMPVLLYLIKTGVPVKSAVSFISNPFVREYAKKQRELASLYSTSEYSQPENKKFIKYQAAGQTMLDMGLNVEELAYSFETKDTGELITVYDAITNKKYYDTITKRMGKKTEFTNEDLSLVINTTDAGIRGNAKANELGLDMFFHFLEIEKQIKGLGALKRQSNPDTTRSKSVQELLIREVNYDDLSEISRVNQDLVNELKNESILSSFRIGDLINDVVNPVFGFRNNSNINDYLTKRIPNTSGNKDDKALLITRFKDGVLDYVFQNYQNGFVNDQGDIVQNPDSYLGLPVKERKNISKGVKVDKAKQILYIDNEQIKKDFGSKVYATDLIRERGLRPLSRDVFRNVSEYKKFVVAREYLRSILSKEDVSKNKDFIKFKAYFKGNLNLADKAASDQAYEAFLNREALFDSFNRATIMGTGEFSYAQTMMDLIKEYPALKDKYEVLNQFYIPKQFGKTEKNIKVLSLKNISQVKKESQLGDTYFQNLSDLADPTIKKVSDPSENLRLSRMFAKLPLISVYQHGVGGYNTQSIVEVLPYTNFLDVINTASEKFVDKHLNDKTLDYVFDKVQRSKGRFIDFTDQTNKYGNPDPVDMGDFENTKKPTQLTTQVKKVENLQKIRFPKYAEDFTVEFIDKEGKEHMLFFDTDVEGVALFRLQTKQKNGKYKSERDSKGKLKNRKETDAFVRENLPNELLDSFLAYRSLNKEKRQVFELHLLGIPLRAVLESEFYTPKKSIEQLTEEFNTLPNNVQALESYVKPFIEATIQEQINASEDALLTLKTDITIKKTKIVLEDYKRALVKLESESTRGYLTGRIVRNSDGSLSIDPRDLSKLVQEIKKEFGPDGKPPIERTDDNCAI